MNITFRLPTPDLEEKFVKKALENGMGGLKATDPSEVAEHPYIMPQALTRLRLLLGL